MVSERDATTESFSPARNRERRKLKAIAGSAAVVLIVLGVASYEFVDRAGRSGKPTAAAHPAASHPAVVAATSPASPSPAPPVSSSPSASALAAQVLKPASAAAFGPDGTADGDGSAQAGLATDGSAATDWRTDWYATRNFGGLQDGTGLLIDMGKTVTVDSVHVVLGGEPGADFELKTGRGATPRGLAWVATVSNAGGTVDVKLGTPEQARYVLLWFTQLPPDNAGTYQAQVDEVSVSGQP
ncbi:MAG TPA: hypothetical protein VFB06_34970 [Streptosporangiaceae bacterium]|nr:hypothetical protein [Streptosporangiaceae bacterium]